MKWLGEPWVYPLSMGAFFTGTFAYWDVVHKYPVLDAIGLASCALHFVCAGIEIERAKKRRAR